MPVREISGLVRYAISGFAHDDGPGMAAEAAYRLVFALPALAIFFTSVSSIAAEYTGVDAFDLLLERAEDGLPEEVFDTLELVFDSIDEQSGIGVLSFGLLIALWSGSSAIAAIVKAINRAHGLEEKRGFVRQRLLAIVLTIGLSLLMVSSFALLIFGEQIGRGISSTLGYGSQFQWILNIARWPVLVLLFMAALAILYRFGPAEPISGRELLPGVLTATLLWVVASYGFGIYLSVVDPGSAYGVLGGILALLLFLYLTSIVIVLGGEMNAGFQRRAEIT